MEMFPPLWTLGVALAVGVIFVGWLIVEMEILEQDEP